MESEVEEVMENQTAAHIAAHDLVVLPTAVALVVSKIGGSPERMRRIKKDCMGGILEDGLTIGYYPILAIEYCALIVRF